MLFQLLGERFHGIGRESIEQDKNQTLFFVINRKNHQKETKLGDKLRQLNESTSFGFFYNKSMKKRKGEDTL